MSANALTIDEHLRRGLDLVLGLERIDLFPRGQRAIIHHIAITLEQMFRFQPVGAGVPGHDHAIQGRAFKPSVRAHVAPRVFD